MDQVEEVKSKVDLVEVISSYLPLKKMGRNLGGLCPFHSEKTPSFMVSPERQVWKCFGCAEGGDVFTFLEKIEGWDFREALEELAKRAGVKLKFFEPTDKSQIREKLIEINKLTVKLYSHLLNNHPAGERARKYLTGRGIKKETWEKFRLGYSPDSWDTLFNFFVKHKIPVSDVAMSGLVVARSGNDRSFYDRFRDRLVFPLADSRGTVMGFSGRVLDSTAKEAKYVNTSETPIFQKGALLFGLDIGRSAIRDKNEAVLVEGEFDVLSSHQAGVENVVASKGTALTDKQAAMLSRLAENVVLCFDTDIAGDSASRRGIELLDMAGVTVRVADLGSAKDPDEFAQKDPKGFGAAISKASNIYDYLIDSAVERFDPATADGQKKIGREILPILSKISDDLVRAHYIEKLARVLGLDVGLVAQAVEKKTADLGGGPTASANGGLHGVNTTMEDYFLALFLAGDKVVSRIVEMIDPSDFSGEAQRLFWKAVRDIIKHSKSNSPAKIVHVLPKDFNDFVDQLYLINISPAFSEKELWGQEAFKTAREIKITSLRRQQMAIAVSLEEAQKKADSKEVGRLTKKIDELLKQRSELEQI
ncbi:MAG: DNA primase [Candidatus Curtissbacteria bacterium]|nr:DNA primase [Candidatus Curtissbacteria bacterium]